MAQSMRADVEDAGAPPVVSVILPVYNGERYVLGAIESVIAQTYDHWELVVVNDGSTDGTPVIVEGVGDPRIRMITQENRGLPEAKNTGIREARGRAIGILDADDLWLPNKLERQVPLLEPGTFVYSDVLFWNEDRGESIGGFEIYDRYPRDTEKFSGDVLPGILSQNLLTNVAVLMWRADATALGGFRGVFGGCEDWDMWIRCAERLRFVRIAEPLAVVRRRTGSLSTETPRVRRAGKLLLTDTRERLRLKGRLTPELRGSLGLGYFNSRAMGRASRELLAAIAHQPWRLRWWRGLASAALWRPLRVGRKPIPGTGGLMREPK